MSPNVAESNGPPSDSRNPVVKFEHPNCQLCTSKNLPYLFSKIRHVETVPKDFEFYSLRLMKLIAEDALALMADKEVDIPTPCGTWRGVAADPENEAFAVSIVRAGDSMLQAVRELVPGIPVAKILIQRDETTKEKTPILYYKKWPKNVANKTALICDPMLATGGSVIMAIKSLLEIGIPEEKMIFVNVISCPEGLNRLGREYPNVKVVTGMVDPMLNSDRFIVPGLGDYGDRFFGTVE
ncbi:Oidioi.mRNA.OKI2018_I69.XSR.g15065.t1.cds [Oikopleura dioica]|uniref:Oidioi.mRNA.OKI2018_I69.XSR.g15065.t1.cds n=1 Tax=Oikopleura dioica TaxID=34765 RepID=A0ABN7SBN4_OIKDI|nr:Oidioi.mRNA.OKI2018_I69.XSR.g15065.t1.cds [Oikopleura dioica]